jgi:hypothetical protein
VIEAALGDGIVTPGDLLVAVELCRGVDPADSRRAALLRAVRRHLALQDRNPPPDTPDALDAIEIAVTAAEVTGAWDVLEAARRIGARVVAARQESGTWFPGGVAADRHRLSLVRGLPAIAHAFLRLAALEPGRSDGHHVASVRLVA